ncbi:glycosyl hydrolase [Adhaeribacter aerolatus]|uniref:Glycosyl hydrolase n=1 Tax=Adhaeribacter aerolatus TaxID=670289 RepID=A0A512AVU5_9BACT|nr:glycoside hydrolase family 127 protein [Adhaeribacter aerolatus]GEO03831.1 glycosyl hydrolase [Adhaeribacter aerolatus]
MKLSSFYVLLLLLMPIRGFSQQVPLQSFPLNAVRLHNSPFKQAQEIDLQYILALSPDRLLAPYLSEAGITPKAEWYGNWENTGLDGHIGGHYLSALSLMYAATGNQEVKQRLDYIIDQLAACQQKNGNGYLGGVPGGKDMWQEIAQGKIDAGTFSLNKKWVPLYNIHKIYAGLLDAYQFGANPKAKDMLVQLTDWCLNLTANLSEAQIQEILKSEHGGLNEVFADVAALTGDKKYLELARKFSHQAILNPLLAQKDALNGIHANTQIPKVIGFMRVAEVAGEQDWAKAADFFWHTVVQNRTVSIGGNSVREHFHPADNFSSMLESVEGPETCNTYNMLKLSKHLFQAKPTQQYIEYYERALYNHILSSQHPEKGGFVYFTPMRPQHYRVYSQPQESFWCCVGSGLENHGKYGELIYAHNTKDLYVNLFIPSELNWPEKGLTLTQETKFPFEEATALKLKLKKPQKFALQIRYPSWVKTRGLKVQVNQKDVIVKPDASGFVAVNRKWKTGDVVIVSLPMQTKVEQMPDKSSWVSFVHGPIVLAAITDTTNLKGLWADGSRMGHIASGPQYPIEEAPMLVSADKDLAAAVQPVADKPLTFRVANLLYPAKYKSLELVPFYQIHEARYMLYWPVTTPEKLENNRKAMRERETARLALEARTVDQVAPGEQQPESDHNFQGEKTESGVFNNRHWRHATGWFSYALKNPKKEARTLQITYFGGDKNRSFDIYVNNTLLRTVKLDGVQGDKFYEVDYQLPNEILNKAGSTNLTVKFIAHQNSTAGGIYYVRLLK